MRPRVFKFGGSCLGSAAAIRASTAILTREATAAP